MFDNFLKHYGTPRHSGRYPYGSGEDGEQRNKSFAGYVNDLKKKGMSEVDIAKGMGITTTKLRAQLSISSAQERQAQVNTASKLKDKGYSHTAIGRHMGINESTVRSLLDERSKERMNSAQSTAALLKDQVKEKGMIDVGVGVERHLNISRTKLQTAVAILEEEGYATHQIYIPQLGTDKKTTMLVLAPPDTSYADVYKNRETIKQVAGYSEDNGRVVKGIEPPVSISSKRVMVNYAEDGGTDKDGVIELRRGVDDISLGKAKYAQVRIAVDDTHYLKGMAVYADDLPPGVDIRFNTNKHKDTPILGDKDNSVLKPLKDDKDNPFGASIKTEENLIRAQRHYTDKNGEKKLSPINIVNEEGDWSTWSKTLSAQMLSKQHESLAEKQLKLAFDIKKEEYDEIMSLTNPVVKKRLLDSFADDCDSAAVHLKAAALPRQGSHVLLPVPSLKEGEIYAPNYRDGETVVLIRYPHGGTFEIPQLTVNNRNKEARTVLGNKPIDAVGIHPKTAELLSGADFDGDTALVIPNPQGKLVKVSKPLKDLEDFNPKEQYPKYPGMKTMTEKTKQLKMGDVSNLITDMTIMGASDSELARAVKHSMVVIDAVKHNLDYKKSFEENGIAALKTKYQGSSNAGAATLISRASSQARVGARKEGVYFPSLGKKLYVDPNTGEKLYTYTNETYTKTKTNKKTGMVTETTHPRLIKSTKMYEADDAFKLSSGTKMEKLYAEHANKLKSLGNQTRKSALAVVDEYVPYSPSAKKAYANEVASLNIKLNNALKNAPLERQATLLANATVDAKKKANPDMTSDELKKIKGKALTDARLRTGAGKQRIDITDNEWKAIQSGAVSTNTLTKILNNTDLDKVKQLATPRKDNELSTAKIARINSLLDKGLTQSEIAEMMGVSTGSVNKLAN